LTNVGDAAQVNQPTPNISREVKEQGWYGRLTEQQRAEYLLKQREARQRMRAAADSTKNAQPDLTLETPGIMNVFYYQRHSICYNFL
jgi:hypothetical protein